MMTLINNTYKNLSLKIIVDKNSNLFLNMNNDFNINIGNIFDFKYSKLNYEIDCRVDEYYSIFNWMDNNANFINIIDYFNNIQFNKEIIRQLKLMKIYER